MPIITIGEADVETVSISTLPVGALFEFTGAGIYGVCVKVACTSSLSHDPESAHNEPWMALEDSTVRLAMGCATVKPIHKNVTVKYERGR